MQHGGKARPVVSGVGVRAGGEPRHVSTTSTARARGCPWLRRLEAPRHMRPSGHSGVIGVHDGDGRRTDEWRESEWHMCLRRARSATDDGARGGRAGRDNR
jgi:hypothetical protein